MTTLNLREYSVADIANCAQTDKISESIANNLVFTKLIREKFFALKDAKFIDIVAYACKHTFNIENLESHHFSRSFNLRSSILARLREAETASNVATNTATTKVVATADCLYTDEQITASVNEAFKSKTEAQIIERLLALNVRAELIKKLCVSYQSVKKADKKLKLFA